MVVLRCPFCMPIVCAIKPVYAKFPSDFLHLSFLFCNFAASNFAIMSYTKEPIVINKPSEQLLKAIKKLREHKHAELERLRDMKPEEFSCRIILK